MPTSEPCPSAETLAAYLDARLPRDERAAVERHLAECEDCFEQLAAAAAFQAEEAVGASGAGVLRHPASPPAGRWRGIAAAAVLALAAVGLWVANRDGGRLPASGGQALAIAERLGGPEELRLAAARAWSDEGQGLAFGGGLTADKRGFRMGVYLLDARVALAARDEARLAAALDLAAGLLRGEREASEASEILERLRGAAPRDRKADLARLARLAHTTRAVAPEAFDFGVWTEAGRLAALLGRGSFFDAEFARRLDEVAGSEAGREAAVARELETLRAVLGDQKVATAEFDALARSFEQILLLN